MPITPIPSAMPAVRENWSFKHGASMLSSHVLTNRFSDARMEEMATAYIRDALAQSLSTLQKMVAPPILSQEEREKVAHIILGGKTDWSQISDHALLHRIDIPAWFMPDTPFGTWVHALFYGSYRRTDTRLDLDVDLDLKQHAVDLTTFYDAIEPYSAFQNLAAIHRSIDSWPKGTVSSTLLKRLQRDHMILMAVVRARMIGEYLRRRSSDPFGQQPSDAAVQWPLASSVFKQGLIEPADNLVKLMGLKVKADAQDSTALDIAINSGRLHYDKRLYWMAERVQSTLHTELRHRPAADAAQAIAGRVRNDTGLLSSVTGKELTAAFGKRNLVEDEFGVTTSTAISVLAIQLATFKPNDAKQPPCLHDTLPRGARTRTRRIATVLVALTGADRRFGDPNPDNSNKVGKKPLNAALKALTSPVMVPRLKALAL